MPLNIDINGIKANIHYISNNFVICSHGLYSNKESKKYIEMAEMALKNNISCVRFDFRGCGSSKGNFNESTLSNRINDLSEVISYLKKNYSNAKISLFGSSFGGMVSIVYAYMHRIKPIVTISTPYKIEGIEKKFVEDANKYHILEMMTKISHILIIHGNKDELVPKSHAEKIYKMAKQPKKILFFNADHSFSNPIERKKAINEAVKWIKSY